MWGSGTAPGWGSPLSSLVVVAALGWLLSGPNAVARGVADQRWLEATTSNFTLFSTAPERETKALLQELEVFRQTVKAITNVNNFKEGFPTRVFYFHSGKAYAQFKREPDEGGYVIPSLREIFLVLGPGKHNFHGKEKIYHDYVHFMLRSRGIYDYPHWYEEGLADMLSSIRIERDKVLVARVPISRSKDLQPDAFKPLPAIMGVLNTAAWTPAEQRLFYAQSWALVHYLHAGSRVGFTARDQQMSKYVALFNAGKISDVAFRQAFNVSYQQLGQELRSYVTRGEYPIIKFPLASIAVSDTSKPKIAKKAVINYQLGKLSLALGPSKALQAEQFLGAALAKEPSHGHIQTSLALAYLGQKRYQQAQRQVQQSLSQAAGDPARHIDCGRVLYAWSADDAAGLTLDQRAELLQRARTCYQQAIDLDNGSMEAIARLGMTYRAAGSDPALGLRYLTTAQKQMSWDAELQMRAGELYLIDGKTAKARKQFARVVRWSHNGETARRARYLLDALNK